METLQLFIFMSLFISICLLMVWDGLEKGFHRILKWGLIIIEVGTVVALGVALAAYLTDLILWIIE